MITDDKKLIAAVRDALIQDGTIPTTELTQTQVEFEKANVSAFVITMFPRTGQTLLNYMDTLHTTGTEYLNYHTERHVISVLQGVLDYISQYQVDSRTVRLLLLAAMFHDANHTLGVMSDRVNTALAVGALSPVQYMGSSIPRCVHHIANYWLADIETERYQEATLFLKDLLELILDTTFPYNDVAEPSYPVGVFRDVDRLTIYRPDWYAQIYSGLYLEQAAPKQIPFVTFCAGQVNFLLSLQVYSLLDNERLATAIQLARHVHMTAKTLGGQS